MLDKGGDLNSKVEINSVAFLLPFSPNSSNSLLILSSLLASPPSLPLQRPAKIIPTSLLSLQFPLLLHRSKLHRTADQIPHLMSSLGKPPSEKQLKILICFHSESRRPLCLHHAYLQFRHHFSLRPQIFSLQLYS